MHTKFVCEIPTVEVDRCRWIGRNGTVSGRRNGQRWSPPFVNPIQSNPGSFPRKSRRTRLLWQSLVSRNDLHAEYCIGGGLYHFAPAL